MTRRAGMKGAQRDPDLGAPQEKLFSNIGKVGYLKRPRTDGQGIRPANSRKSFLGAKVPFLCRFKPLQFMHLVPIGVPLKKDDDVL